MRRNRSARPECSILDSWWNRSPLVISTISCPLAIDSTALGCRRSTHRMLQGARPISITRRMSRALIRSPVAVQPFDHRQGHALGAIADTRRLGFDFQQVLQGARIVRSMYWR